MHQYLAFSLLTSSRSVIAYSVVNIPSFNFILPNLFALSSMQPSHATGSDPERLYLKAFVPGMDFGAVSNVHIQRGGMATHEDVFRVQYQEQQALHRRIGDG